MVDPAAPTHQQQIDRLVESAKRRREQAATIDDKAEHDRQILHAEMLEYLIEQLRSGARKG